MTTYERRLNGRVVPGSRQIPEPGMYDDTRLGLLVLERRESGERDGWYEDGEWDAVEAARQAAAANVTYSASSVEQLRAELKHRGLPTSGNKPDLIAALQHHDSETGQAPAITLDTTEEG